MQLRINNFYIYISFPAVAFVAAIVISNFYTNYLLCLGAVIIHESGHLIFMYLLGIIPSGIEIRPFNITIIEKQRYKSPLYIDIIITSAGPLFNFLLYICCFNNFLSFAYVNLLLGLFNLLPAAALDGGQILYLLLTKIFSREKSAKIIDITTILVSLPIFFIGLFVLLNSKYNFSLLFIGLYLILTLFIRDKKYL